MGEKQMANLPDTPAGWNFTTDNVLNALILTEAKYQLTTTQAQALHKTMVTVITESQKQGVPLEAKQIVAAFYGLVNMVKGMHTPTAKPPLLHPEKITAKNVTPAQANLLMKWATSGDPKDTPVQLAAFYKFSAQQQQVVLQNAMKLPKSNAVSEWVMAQHVEVSQTMAPPGLSGVGSFSQKANPWQLDKLNLKTECADFYLLYDLSLDSNDEGLFKKKLDYLDGQFSRYTDMAVGGELRHALKKIGHANMPKPIADALKDELAGGRHAAWKGWYHLRQTYGTKALVWASAAFNKTGWTGAYGGPKWGAITDHLLRYEQGQMSPLMFVDLCWGLEHNGGCYFNKSWSTNSLFNVLEANKKEKFDVLVAVASAKVKKLWAKHHPEGGE